MQRHVLARVVVGALFCLSWTVGVPAQIIFESDFETTFPNYGYSYGYSGYGTPDCGTNVDSSADVSSSYDVQTGPAGMADFDTTLWNLPADPGPCWTYAGWGLGIGYILPDGTRLASGNLADYTLTFDASVTGYDVILGGLETQIALMIQMPDADGDGRLDDHVWVVQSDNLGNFPLVPFLTDTPQTLTFNLADMGFDRKDGDLDFATDYGQALQVQFQLQPYGDVVSIGIDADNVLTIDNVRFEGPATMLPSGDFNGDSFFDCADIDALVAEIVAGTNRPAYDLNGDGEVNPVDITDPGRGWLALAGADASNAGITGGNPFLQGDANLDGSVDVSDFNVWNGSKFTSGVGWCGGDFNADGSADVSDFNTWNGSKFQSSSSPAAVPEPVSWSLLGCGLAMLLGRHRRR